MLAANDVASVIIARNVRSWTDAWSLQKLLYYVQAWHLAITDEPLFSDQVKAWEHGPVVPSVRIARKDQATRRAAAQDLSGIELSETASSLIDLVIGAYGSMSAEELSALTHAELPWMEARGDLPPEAPSTEPISHETMARFYRKNRTLGGRTAADLAAVGVYVRRPDVVGPVDIDAILESITDDLPSAPDPWGGGNLADASQYDSGGIEQQAQREYVDF